MPDCGQNADYDALKDYLVAITGALALVMSGDTAAVKSVANAALGDFESHIRQWVTELAMEVPGAPMLPKLLAVVALAQAAKDDPSIINAIALNIAKTELEKIYGAAVAQAGASVDELITDLLKGAVPCELVPNIVTNSSGDVVEEAKKPLYAQSDALGEDPSVENPIMKALKDKIGGDMIKTIAAKTVSTTIYEQSMGAIFQSTNPLKEAITPSRSPQVYWHDIKALQDLDRAVNVQQILSSPSIQKQELDNTRQGTSIQGPNVLSKPVVPVLDPQTIREWEEQAKKTARYDDYNAEQSNLFTIWNKQASSGVQALSYAQRLEKYKKEEGSGYISWSDYIEANPL
jgi:hypothetical protein